MKVFFLMMKESRALLGTVMGWFVLAAFLLVFGVMWAMQVTVYLTWSEQLTGGQGTEILRLSDNLVTPMYANLVLIFIFLCPAISMRLFAEEFKQNTMELLYTAPISTAEIVLGKYLGAMAYVGLMLCFTLYAPVFLSIWQPHDVMPYVGCYMGLFLLSSALIAMGMFFSSWSSSQIGALIPSFAFGLGLYLLAFSSAAEGNWFQHFALGTHANEFFFGILQWSHVMYFVLFTGFFLLATQQRLEANRWQ